MSNWHSESNDMEIKTKKEEFYTKEFPALVIYAFWERFSFYLQNLCRNSTIKIKWILHKTLLNNIFVKSKFLFLYFMRHFYCYFRQSTGFFFEFSNFFHSWEVSVKEINFSNSNEQKCTKFCIDIVMLW